MSCPSGVVQPPIVGGTTENHTLTIPPMICAILADAVSKGVHPRGTHHTPSRDDLPAGGPPAAAMAAAPR